MSVSLAWRPAMAELIDRVRRLTGDTDPDAPILDDIAIQQHLDGHRRSVHNLELVPAATDTPGDSAYLDFYTPDGWADWETDGTLTDGTDATVVPASSDWLSGHWTFAAEPAMPVRLTGTRYDMHAAAADAAEAAAAALARCYDFAADGQSFSRSQMHRHFLETAGRLRERAEPVGVTLSRGDVR